MAWAKPCRSSRWWIPSKPIFSPTFSFDSVSRFFRRFLPSQYAMAVPVVGGRILSRRAVRGASLPLPYLLPGRARKPTEKATKPHRVGRAGPPAKRPAKSPRPARSPRLDSPTPPHYNHKGPGVATFAHPTPTLSRGPRRNSTHLPRARERFLPGPPLERRFDAGGGVNGDGQMYERFTDRARKVMQLANQEAQRFNHEYIGTEHILLGLVKEGSGVAANVLKNLDIDLRKIRLEVEKIVQSGPDMVTMGKLPQTPRAKKVIEYSIEEARNLGHNYVGTEHLLLGLLREQEGVAAQVLMNLGLKLEDVREEVLNLLGHNMATE